MKLLWRALGENTSGYTFSIFESTFAPGMGIPLHKHPFGGVFLRTGRHSGNWVLEQTRVSLSGTCVKPGRVWWCSPMCLTHSSTRVEHACRMLSVSTYHHERMMKDAVQPDGRTDFLPAQLTQDDFQKLTKSMEKNQTFLVADHAQYRVT